MVLSEDVKTKKGEKKSWFCKIIFFKMIFLKQKIDSEPLFWVLSVAYDPYLTKNQ